MKNLELLLEAAGYSEAFATSPESDYDQMVQEIAQESAIDEAFMDMDASAMVSAVEGTTYFFESLADREASLECNAGKEYGDICASFSLEAARDVLKRKAYVGIAAIKALIAAIIGWFKNLLGFSTASKKIFKSIQKKMEKELKEVQKLRVKNHEKSKRNMVTDLKEKANDVVKVITNGIADIKGNLEGENAPEYLEEEEKKDKIEKIKENLDFSSKDELEGSAFYDKVVADLKAFEAIAKANTADDMAKVVNNKIKEYDKKLKELSNKKETDDIEADNASRAKYNKTLATIRQIHEFMKHALKAFVTLADQVLINAKAFRASL